MSERKYNIFISKTYYINQYNIIIFLLFEKCMLLFNFPTFQLLLFGEFLLQANYYQLPYLHYYIL